MCSEKMAPGCDESDKETDLALNSLHYPQKQSQEDVCATLEKSGGAGAVCGCTGALALGAVTLLSLSIGWNRVKAMGARPCGSSGAGESSKTFHRLCSSGATQWPIP